MQAGVTIVVPVLQSPLTLLTQDSTISSTDMLTLAANNNNNNNIATKNSNVSSDKPGTKSTSAKSALPKQVKRLGQKTTGNTPPLKPPKKYRNEDNEIQRCKRRLDFAKLGLPFNRPNPVSVARRNERERKRVKQINVTFANLRDHLPSDYYENKNPNKMSKVDTLRAAIDYINGLQDLLENSDAISGLLSNGAFPQDSLSVQASAEHLQSVSMDSVESVNSPAGSTCSSVASQSSGSETYAHVCSSVPTSVYSSGGSSSSSSSSHSLASSSSAVGHDPGCSLEVPMVTEEDQLSLADLTALHMAQGHTPIPDEINLDHLLDFSWL